MPVSRPSLSFCLTSLALFAAGCGSNGNSGNPTTTGNDAGSDAVVSEVADTAGETGPTPPTLAVSCSDTIDSVYADPGALPATKGAIIKCAIDKHLSVADVQGHLDAVGYKGAKATTGGWSLRVLYRTTRGDGKGTPGTSSAWVLIPDTAKAAAMPATIVSRGSRGQGVSCAPSKQDPAANDVNPDLYALTMPLFGNGFPIIVPDGPGYANPGPNNPPPAYFSTLDMGQTMLDGSAALQNVLPASSMNGKVLIVGHSEGAANALSALAIAEKYGVKGTIAGVAVFAPIWFSMRAWGAEFVLHATYPISSAPDVNAIVLWYNYTHAELLDGPGAGKKLIQTSMQSAADHFVRSDCWGQYTDLSALGTDTTSFFDPTFVSAVQSPAALGADCDTAEPAHTICTTWLARYDADRPHLTGAAATTPILGMFGLKDDFVGQDRFQCGIDRLATDKAKTTWCLDSTADHSGITRVMGDHAIAWLSARALGTPEPTKCAIDETGNVDSTGKAVPCASLPPNVP